MIYHETEHGVLYCGDCLDIMKTLPDNSVDSVVTDPPYGLSFMGKKWDYDVPSVSIWQECLRVLKPGGHLVSFGGSRTYHRLACLIEDAGFEVRDMGEWLYGSGFPKSLNIGNGFGTALKPAHEPFCIARKPVEGTVAANVLKWVTGAIDIDGCRVEYQSKIDSDSTLRANTPNAGRYVHTNATNIDLPPAMKDYDPSKGRFPANLIHDGSDEVVECFPNNAARFFYCAKASKAERNAGCEGLPERSGGSNAKGYTQDIANGLDRNRPTTNHHPTVKPIALMRYLIKLVTPPNGTVLDPFLGSGTTAIAAVLEGFDWIGIEREAEYCEIAARRIETKLDQTDIFREES